MKKKELSYGRKIDLSREAIATLIDREIADIYRQRKFYGATAWIVFASIGGILWTLIQKFYDYWFVIDLHNAAAIGISLFLIFDTSIILYRKMKTFALQRISDEENRERYTKSKDVYRNRGKSPGG